jgi:hypothetical protein
MAGNNFIQTNLKNLVKSFKLTERQYIFPLYEVIVNSIQAIHEKNSGNGKIDVYIKRTPLKQLEIDGKEAISPIISYEVVDNGIGFNEKNRESFSQAYTDYKAELGCKGVGRFMTLVAFDKVEIDSIFFSENDREYQRHTFDFDITNHIYNEKTTNSDASESKTIVKLNDYRPEFRKATQPDTIATMILNHCLIYFISRKQPKITIYDDFLKKPINLDDVFEKLYRIDDNIDTIDLMDESFEINYVKNYVKSGGSHKIHYCGDTREVKTENLSTHIPTLEKKISDIDGAFFISAYVKSDYLNRNLLVMRDEFTIPKTEKDKDAFNNISFDEINKAVAEKVKSQFDTELNHLNEEHKQSYIDFILSGEGIEYRHLLEHSTLFNNIKPAPTNEEKELVLHKLNYELEKQQKVRINKFLNEKIDRIQNKEEYKEFFEELLENENDLGKSKLINYMLHRKTVLKVLEKFIAIQNSGTYKLEADIHDIFFIRNKTSNQIAFNDHNLWILDERIAYSKYIASDKKLKEIEFIDSTSEEKPDLIIFDNKFVYGDPKSSLVIFEFKRPMRDYYSKEEKNVGDQIVRYIKSLVSGDAETHSGRPFNVNMNTPKFGYVICDIDKEIKNELEMSGYEISPKDSYFKYEKGLNLFIEVMNYDQLLEDANLRHKAFFTQLGIQGL